ncbi:Protein of unknown function (DUF3602) [Geosmithia morbida]|uniref:Uncharacterized protein n=1 Tax=Geosmithia morbida TaxID=1094350 RepID=A0A9P4YV71_9HYPO|nr:Protein of unknown function (DUF3602) [Geosmithia morbida]KAF4122650.1 Protein of unknown function (DUF3602) [Geosmithia morbida]
MSTEVSHGRGGAGNINPDETEYVDGSIVRVGPEGSHGDGAYSAGRGGVGNIGDAGTLPSERRDSDMVPEEARKSLEPGEAHHLGRGGIGNEQPAPEDGKPKAPAAEPKPKVPVGLADKLKNKLFGKK